MAVFSAPTRHAIFVLAHMAQSEEGKARTVRSLSAATGISESTVAKVLLSLVKGGVLVSKKGPGGGFLLAVPQEQLTLGRILLAIEGGDLFSDCVAGLGLCDNEGICPLHAKWISVKQMLVDFLNFSTVQEIDLPFLSENK